MNDDSSQLTPYIPEGGSVLELDFPALHIGVAEYREGPTGCTVFYFPNRARVAADIRGGSPGTLFSTDAVTDTAICLAGGSLLGLEAATGVAAELFQMRRYSTDWHQIPVVSGAILYDFARDNAIYPDKALGRAALTAARTGIFPLGPRGAGSNVYVGGVFGKRERAGQGGAFRQIGPVKIAAFVVMNSMGVILDRQGRVVRGNLDSATGHRRHPLDQLEARAGAGEIEAPVPRNTTLTVVVTNQRLDDLRQFGRQVHSSMARAIQPFHTRDDGDVLYAVTTSGVDVPELAMASSLGLIASEVVWDAILTSFVE